MEKSLNPCVVSGYVSPRSDHPSAAARWRISTNPLPALTLSSGEETDTEACRDALHLITRPFLDSPRHENAPGIPGPIAKQRQRSPTGDSWGPSGRLRNRGRIIKMGDIFSGYRTRGRNAGMMRMYHWAARVGKEKTRSSRWDNGSRGGRMWYLLSWVRFLWRERFRKCEWSRWGAEASTQTIKWISWRAPSPFPVLWLWGREGDWSLP